MEDIVRRRKEKEKQMKGAVMKWKGKKEEEGMKGSYQIKLGIPSKLGTHTKKYFYYTTHCNKISK